MQGRFQLSDLYPVFSQISVCKSTVLIITDSHLSSQSRPDFARLRDAKAARTICASTDLRLSEIGQEI